MLGCIACRPKAHSNVIVETVAVAILVRSTKAVEPHARYTPQPGGPCSSLVAGGESFFSHAGFLFFVFLFPLCRSILYYLIIVAICRHQHRRSRGQ